MIEIKLTNKECQTILKSLKNCNDKELYSKFWRLQFNNNLVKKGET
jgi:hypothetical protein